WRRWWRAAAGAAFRGAERRCASGPGARRRWSRVRRWRPPACCCCSRSPATGRATRRSTPPAALPCATGRGRPGPGRATCSSASPAPPRSP
ncbi:MAG: hypothetical protein AVDCRST_MAG39-130, partial [uncultured Sphingomonadaceae bacterium]